MQNKEFGGGFEHRAGLEKTKKAKGKKGEEKVVVCSVSYDS